MQCFMVLKSGASYLCVSQTTWEEGRGGGGESFILWRIFSQDNKKKYIRYFSNLTQPGLSEVEPLWDLSTRGA